MKEEEDVLPSASLRSSALLSVLVILVCRKADSLAPYHATLLVLTKESATKQLQAI
jgi:hypothetical protein